jgi:hypothetical protein
MKSLILIETLGALALLLVVFAVSLALVRLAVSRRPAPARRGSPRRIHLRRQDDRPLRDTAGVEARAHPLLDRGFIDGGIWAIDELSLAVRALVAADAASYAVVYDEHPVAGTWIDLVTLYEDGTSLTVNDLARPSALDERPGHRKVRVPGARSDELYARMLEEREEKPTLRLALEDIPARFEKAYADEIDWRDARGGPTEAEIRRIAAASGKTLTNEQVRKAREIMEEQTRGRRDG